MHPKALFSLFCFLPRCWEDRGRGQLFGNFLLLLLLISVFFHLSCFFFFFILFIFFFSFQLYGGHPHLSLERGPTIHILPASSQKTKKKSWNSNICLFTSYCFGNFQHPSAVFFLCFFFSPFSFSFFCFVFFPFMLIRQLDRGAKQRPWIVGYRRRRQTWGPEIWYTLCWSVLGLYGPPSGEPLSMVRMATDSCFVDTHV